ncbi:hypothetical protein AAG570_002075 [Ranatra chinensis]|uniref:Tubulin glycylase 3A n=1 Tax=Ranatra chinensis TaxID=642074 RepID=A0ABD0YAN5_9HEMI
MGSSSTRNASPSINKSQLFTSKRHYLSSVSNAYLVCPQGHKTFTIFGRFPSIRDALKARGWVQNFDLRRLTPSRQRQYQDELSWAASRSDGRVEDKDDCQLISRMLRNTPVSFVWVMGESIDWKSLGKSTIVSRFPRVYFTTKVGLCSYMQQSHWYVEGGVSSARFPRCYNISTSEDLNTFIKDFRLTACFSLLQSVLANIDRAGGQFFSEHGEIPLSVVEFAAKRCSEFVAGQEHEDIDKETDERVWDHQWDQFLTNYYKTLNDKTRFQAAHHLQIEAIYSCCKVTLESARPYWPQMDMDGVHNLWIVKPAAKSRGRGIHVMSNLEDILSKLGTLHPNDPRFVIQKYIERPLLIHETKFDIRQWFLVTSSYPLTIWMYKESYLRFCSQLYCLNNMHESVHLSNNAVQCKYKNANRHHALPQDNMWDCYTFQTYLRTIGMTDKWDTVIYPGMRECITGSLLAAQEHMEPRRNCFELYGADFILTEDFVPWLIEINSSPCMSPTTSVTARMCSQCLEDVIKVVIDRKLDKDAKTGMFEMVYRQQISSPQPYTGMNLTVKGNRIGRYAKPKTKSFPDEDFEPGRKPATSGVASSTVESSSAEDSVLSKTPRVRKRPKKHSCVSSQHQYSKHSRHFNNLARRVRLHSRSVTRLDIPQNPETYDWRRRVERTRATCERVLLRLNQLKNESCNDENLQPRTADKMSASPKRVPSLPEIKVGQVRDNNNNSVRSAPSFLNIRESLPRQKLSTLEIPKLHN